jgi:hemoglobin
MQDILSKNDIEILIQDFYANLLEIEEMKVVFEGLDFQKHLPNIVSFWSFVLLDEEGYQTNVFEKHRNLPIQLPMFDIWLRVFIASVDRLYAGEKAELAKQRAQLLTITFKSKWSAIVK